MRFAGSLTGWPATLLLAPLAVSLSAAAVHAPRATVSPCPIGGSAGRISFRDVGGKVYSSATLHGHRALVLIFLSTECPVSKSYASRLQALQRDYAGRGVLLVGVDSNYAESRAVVASQARERGFTFPMIKDDGGELARRLGASTTPEAVVIDSSGVLRYRGRIDDQRIAADVKRRDLRNALDAVLARGPVPVAETTPFGCAIQSAPLVAAAHPKVTFTRDVAPILQAKCQSCHRPGEIGPFSLLTYESARPWAGLIKDYTQRRLMPPWKPADGFGQFADVRRLTDAQVHTIVQWVNEGTPRGDPKDMPPPRQFVDGWMLGKPDLVLDAGDSYEVTAEGRDVYRNFVLPYVPDKDQWVSAVEVRPDQRAVVHHVILYGDPLGKSVELNAAARAAGADPGPGYTGSGVGPGFFPAEFLGGWAPGNTPRFAPPGIALRIPAHSRLVLQVHYHKDGKPHRDRTRVGLHFATGPIDKEARALPIVNMGLQIPPGVARQEIRATAHIPTDVTARVVIPHMHLLGREMKITATLPDGSVKPMVWIKDWDFNWQETYVFKEPMKLPKGSRIDVVAYYDNSTGNPHNPNNPPKLVTWGEQTTDEMCVAFVGVTVDAEHLAANAGAGKIARSEK